MQGEKIVSSVHVAGTLAANQQGLFVFPFAVTIIALTAVASNATNATITLGSVADTDGYLTSQAIGVSNVPAIFDKDDWNGALLPTAHVADVDNIHVAANTPIAWVLDFDGSAGTAAQHVDISLVVVEG